jgi:hypothetical protein
MSSRQDFLASLFRERTSHLDVIAHVDQQAWHVHEDVLGRSPAGRAWEVVWTGSNGGDGGIKTFLTEYMIALQSHRSDKGTMTYRAHEMFVIFENIVQSPQINGLLDPAIRIHTDQLAEVHDADVPSRAKSSL